MIKRRRRTKKNPRPTPPRKVLRKSKWGSVLALNQTQNHPKKAGAVQGVDKIFIIPWIRVVTSPSPNM